LCFMRENGLKLENGASLCRVLGLIFHTSVLISMQEYRAILCDTHNGVYRRTKY
jgi:hypothetical protein